MADEEFGVFAVAAENAVIGFLKGVLEALGEDADEGQYSYDTCDEAKGDILEIEPSEDHEGNGGHEENECDDRGEGETETFLICFSGCGICGAETFFERSVGVMGLEEYGAKCGRKCQRVQSGDTDSNSHGQTELTVEDTGGARHERNGDEHEHHDKRD